MLYLPFIITKIRTMIKIQSIKQIVDLTQKDKSCSYKYQICKVTTNESDEIQKLSFLADKYVHIIDSFGINHIIKNHFDFKSELLRGQIAVTAPEILRSFETLEYA